MGDGSAPKEAAAARPRREPYTVAPNQDQEVLYVRTFRENLRENLLGTPERVAPGGNARVPGRRVSAPPQVVHQRHMPVGTQKFHIPRKTKEKLVKRSNQEGPPVSVKDEDEVIFVRSYLLERPVRDRARVPDRTGSPPQGLHQRHMPKGTAIFHIPKKSKEKLALFQPLSCESREYEDMLTVLTSGYLDSASASSFSYSKPRLVHSEILEKEFVEKRKELKADGRTEKELEESYCFLLTVDSKLQTLCEKGLSVGHSRITLLGNPQKGVYVSRCSDLLQVGPISPGATGEILILKVIKGKVKSMYENMKNLLDPTPRFDSHLSKSISKVTSVLSYRAFELTQHYFYEYSFDELRQRPRQVCPYAVVSFQFKGKDTALISKPMAPLRSNSQTSEKSQEKAQFSVWSGNLVKDKVLFQISLQSSSPFLPHELPEKLEMKWVMSWDKATTRLPQSLFSYNLYNNSSEEVVKDDFYCSFLEVVDRNRSMTSVSKLLQELETKALVLVMPLSERGLLLLLSSVQMASTHERGENWRRSLHALFVFPETRFPKPAPQSTPAEPSPDLITADSVMPGLNHFVPALHFALGKARSKPSPELAAGVEQQAQDYLNGIKEGVLRPYSVAQYDPGLEQAGRQYPPPIMHRLGLELCLKPYLCGPALYQLQLSRVRAMVQQLYVPTARPQQKSSTLTQGDQKMQQLIDLVRSCKRNAEKEVQSEVQSEMKSGGRKRKMEQETAQRTIKHLKASQELRQLNPPHTQDNADVASSSPSSFSSLIGSVGLKDADLRNESSELASKLVSLLSNLNQIATEQSSSEPREAGPSESSPFDRLALKLGLPTNCDIDLRKHDNLEGGSVSSQEGFSPSHSGDPRTTNRAGSGPGPQEGFSPSHSGDPRTTERERGLDQDPRRAGTMFSVEEPPQPDIPWILIPITGLPQKHYARRDSELPRDPRVHHLTSSLPPTDPPPMDVPPASTSPTQSAPTAGWASPEPSPPDTPSLCPSPDPSLPHSHCPSPEEEHTGPRSSLIRCLEPGSPELTEAFSDPPENEEIQDLWDKAEPSRLSCRNTPSPMTVISSTQLCPSVQEEELNDVSALPLTSERLVRDVDCILDCVFDSFSSDLQGILQDQHIAYNLPQSPHSTSNPERTACRTDSHALVSQFSQYVSFYYPCPSVQHYVQALQKEIAFVLHNYVNNQPQSRPDTTTSCSTDAPPPDLVSRISEFVSSIRAANEDTPAIPESRIWPTDSEQEVATSSMDCNKGFVEETNQNDGVCSNIETDIDISNNGRRQVQFGSNRIEICFRNEPEARGNNGSREAGVGNATPEQSSVNSDPNTLNSVINQLQPEMFTTLVDIIKDIKRNAQHFYLHCSQENDFTIQQIRAQLSRQSYVEQSPVLYLNQEENANRKMLVVIKNQEVATHIHQIPELLALKRSPSVQFLGVDKADDLRNQSGQELFVSGGQLLSDETVLNPDIVSYEKLSALLSVLETHSSSENLWRWKVHSKAHKKLKEQSRFRRDAASLLEVLTSFQKRQLVEFLPYHKCDMSLSSGLLECAVELQATFRSFRHTVLLTDDPLVKSSGGVIVCGIDEFLQDFRKLMGYRDVILQEPITDEPQPTEGPSQSGLVPPEDLVSESGLGPQPSDQDFEVLHRTISQMRAERQRQLRDQSNAESEGQVAVSVANPFTPAARETTQRVFTPAAEQVSKSGVTLAPPRPELKVVAATLDRIYSALHPAPEDQTAVPVQAQIQTQVQATEPTGLQRSQETQVRPAERTTNQIRDESEGSARVTGSRKNSPEVETRRDLECKKDPETPIQKAAGSKGGDSGGKGSTVPSKTVGGATVSGKSQPAAAPKTRWNQSNNNQRTTTAPTSVPVIRTKSEGKPHGNVQQDVSSAAKANAKAKPCAPIEHIQVADAHRQKIRRRSLKNPFEWRFIAFVKDCNVFELPFRPFSEDLLKELTSKSVLSRVVELPCGDPKPGWCAARVTIYERPGSPWALVEKRHDCTATPLCFLFGVRNRPFPPVSRRGCVPQVAPQVAPYMQTQRPSMRTQMNFYEDGFDKMWQF